MLKMFKVTFLATMILALAPSIYSQAQVSVAPQQNVGASVGRARRIAEAQRLPGKHNLVHVVARHPKAGCAKTEECGTIFHDESTYNLVTNAGLNWLADIMSNTSTPAVNAQCNYIALTNSAITPGATDTTLSGEIVANGLSRAQGTYTHSANATTFTVAKTFTDATAPQAAQAGGVFTASSGGTMCFEDTFTSASLQIGDTLTVTWTVTI